MENIIKNFSWWDIETCNSCINTFGNTWIEFDSFKDYKLFAKKAYENFLIISENNDRDVRDTLYFFIENKAEVALTHYRDYIPPENDENDVVYTGILDIGVNLRFPNELLKEFKMLFFEVFPPE